MLTGDEEDSGKPESISRGDMVAAAKRSDIALSFEATVLNTATVGRRGSSSWSLEVQAKTGHTPDRSFAKAWVRSDLRSIAYPERVSRKARR